MTASRSLANCGVHLHNNITQNKRQQNMLSSQWQSTIISEELGKYLEAKSFLPTLPINRNNQKTSTIFYAPNLFCNFEDILYSNMPLLFTVECSQWGVRSLTVVQKTKINSVKDWNKLSLPHQTKWTYIKERNKSCRRFFGHTGLKKGLFVWEKSTSFSPMHNALQCE